MPDEINDWQSIGQQLLTELAAMEKRQQVDNDTKFATMEKRQQADNDAKFAALEKRLLVDNTAKHLEIMGYLQQLIVEQFATRMEVTKLTGRVAALEGKKPNGHAVQGT